MIIPFVLWEGSGTPSSFGLCFLAGILVALINTAFENGLVRRALHAIEYIRAVGIGLLVGAVDLSMLAFWKMQGALQNPIAHYGIGRTAVVLVLLIITFRCLSLIGDRVPVYRRSSVGKSP